MLSIYPNLTFAQKKPSKSQVPSEGKGGFKIHIDPEEVNRIIEELINSPNDAFEHDAKNAIEPGTIDLHPDGTVSAYPRPPQVKPIKHDPVQIDLQSDGSYEVVPPTPTTGFYLVSFPKLTSIDHEA
ncbi:MAG TPA: hypothetical protein VIG33_04090, partial [Pseudobdellovibrionaceae bacterium]